MKGSTSVLGCLMISLALCGCDDVNIFQPQGSAKSGSTNTISTASSTGTSYTISGTVSGLAGSGLVLQDNGGDNLAVSANGTFTFASSIASGGVYNVTVSTPPSSPAQVCSVASGSGTVAGNIANVQVTCVTTYTISGTVSGLAGSGLVLQDNGGDNVAMNANGSFTFATAVTSGSGYNVSVYAQPVTPTQYCNVTNGSGSATANIINVQVWCVTPASPGTWTWMGGSNTPRAAGVYGTLGVAAAGNMPGARLAAVSLRDASGNLWLFGGAGEDASGTMGMLNDLWEYTPATGLWTWVSGSTAIGASGVWGTTPAPANTPSARRSSTAWADGRGNLWLFGGWGLSTGWMAVGWLDDLWEFTPATGQWVFVSGQSVDNMFGIYGTQGVAAATNYPGGREGALGITDAAGNLWLFGGFGWAKELSVHDFGAMNDLWKFSPATGQWTWVSGPTQADTSASYGIQGVAAATTLPPPGSVAMGWIDAGGNLWLYAGMQDIAYGPGYFGSMWTFNPATGWWNWMGGDTGIDAAAVYGTLGLPAVTNYPGNRAYAATWVDGSGNFWMFGGDMYTSLLTIYTDAPRNDLWRYVP